MTLSDDDLALLKMGTEHSIAVSRSLGAPGVRDYEKLLSVVTELIAARKRIAEIDSPEVNDFLDGVKREAEHQRLRHAVADFGKTDADWFWTVGYLVGKALHLKEKRLHHLITAAALLFNWHRYTKEQS